jgi:hypothetical protein
VNCGGESGIISFLWNVWAFCWISSSSKYKNVVIMWKIFVKWWKATCEICKVNIINMSKIVHATLASCIDILYRLRNCKILGSDRNSNLITLSHSVGSIPWTFFIKPKFLNWKCHFYKENIYKFYPDNSVTVLTWFKQSICTFTNIDLQGLLQFQLS